MDPNAALSLGLTGSVNVAVGVSILAAGIYLLTKKDRKLSGRKIGTYMLVWGIVWVTIKVITGIVSFVTYTILVERWSNIHMYLTSLNILSMFLSLALSAVSAIIPWVMAVWGVED